ncbi:Fur family transcriptional regulator [candidate division KSB1 bacterium]
MELNEVIGRFKVYLHTKGLRYTPERDVIIREIFSNANHFDADELYLKLMTYNNNVSRATVYRCLNLLESCDLVNKTSFGERHYHYEHTYKRKHHDHLVCKKCGKIVEFTDLTIEQRQKDVCSRYKFILTDHKLQIFGICPDCQKKSKRR